LSVLVLSCFATFLLLFPSQPAHSAPGSILAFAWRERTGNGDLAQGPRRLVDSVPLLAPFWLVGVLVACLRNVAAWTSARRLRRSGVCCAPDFWQKRLSLLAGRLRVSRPVVLLESCLAEVPVMVGHSRPVILMPVGLLTGLPAGQIEAILLHELAHIRRHDYLVNFARNLSRGPVVLSPGSVVDHSCDSDGAGTLL
jgi:hypothetical protein